MPRSCEGASGPYTIRAVLTPMRRWTLPLHCRDSQRPQVLFDKPVADAVDEMCVAKRFILGPADAGIERETSLTWRDGECTRRWGRRRSRCLIFEGRRRHAHRYDCPNWLSCRSRAAFLL